MTREPRTDLYIGPPLRLILAPRWWHERGLQQTASGYGARLVSQWMVQHGGRRRRIYVTQHGNAGSAWMLVRGVRTYLPDFVLYRPGERMPGDLAHKGQS